MIPLVILLVALLAGIVTTVLSRIDDYTPVSWERSLARGFLVSLLVLGIGVGIHGLILYGQWLYWVWTYQG